MTEDFIRNRITQLRIKKDISEYQMSLELGHSKSYIQSISSGRALPSMTEFLAICEYLEITPQEFFDEENANPQLTHKIFSDVKNLKESDLTMLIALIQRLQDH